MGREKSKRVSRKSKGRGERGGLRTQVERERFELGFGGRNPLTHSLKGGGGYFDRHKGGGGECKFFLVCLWNMCFHVYMNLIWPLSLL